MAGSHRSANVEPSRNAPWFPTSGKEDRRECRQLVRLLGVSFREREDEIEDDAVVRGGDDIADPGDHDRPQTKAAMDEGAGGTKVVVDVFPDEIRERSGVRS